MSVPAEKFSTVETVDAQAELRPCIVVPVYNHRQALTRTLPRFAALGLPCVLVDDGSTDGSGEYLEEFARSHPRFQLVRRLQNGGKGAAVLDGFRAALTAGYTHAFQVDCDGQHEIESIPSVLRTAEAHPDCVIIGAPVFDSSAPRARVWGRELSNVLVRIQTLRFFGPSAPRDVLCGFRVYPIVLYRNILFGLRSERMDFDIDVLVRLCWAGAPLRNFPTRVHYPEDGVSHFKYVKDNVTLTLLHLRLLAGMLVRSPMLLAALASGRSGRNFGRASWAVREESGSLFWTKFLFATCRFVGRRFSNVLAYPATLYFVVADGPARRASCDYLARIFHYPSPSAVPFRLVYNHFLEFARALIDKVAVWSGRIGFVECIWHGKEEIRERIDRGQGVILIGAHHGNIEVCRAISAELPRLRINSLMFTKLAARYNAVLKQLAPDAHMFVISMETMGPQIVITLQQALARGECLGLLADRVTPGAPEKTVLIDFLGSPAEFPSGPMILASLLDAPVYLCFALRRKDGRFDVHFELFAEKITLPRTNRDAAIKAEVQRYARRLEHYCRVAPFQWFNFFEFWKSHGAEVPTPSKSAKDE